MTGITLIEIGTITRAHGLRGAVVAIVPSGRSSVLGNLAQVFVGHAADGATAIAIEEASWMPSGWKLKLVGVNDEAGALALKGRRLFVARETLPEPKAGEYYLADLEGAVGIDTHTNQEVGMFEGIEEGPGNGWWRFVSEGLERLVPPNTRYIARVDVAAKKIFLDHIEELP